MLLPKAPLAQILLLLLPLLSLLQLGCAHGCLTQAPFPSNTLLIPHKIGGFRGESGAVKRQKALHYSKVANQQTEPFAFLKYVYLN